MLIFNKNRMTIRHILTPCFKKPMVNAFSFRAAGQWAGRAGAQFGAC
jgi:hypothetical protein